MQPDFQLLADSQDVTVQLHDRLLSLYITDEVGFRSDTIELQLDDRDAAIKWPRHGAELDVFLGYKHSSLTRMGRYVVDEVECSGPPFCLVIRGKASNPRTSLSSKQARSWEQITLGDLVATVAAEHGLVSKVAESLASITIDHIDQTDESDSHLLTRLAKDVGAVVKPVAGFLLFVPRGDAKSASGQALPTTSIAATDIIRYRLTQAAQGKYTAVCARWYDIDTANEVFVLVGEGKPVYTLRHPYPNAEEALRAATAKLDALQRGISQLSLTVIGKPECHAEGKIRVSGLHYPVDGQWLAQRVEHQLDSKGFISRIEAEVPKR